MVVVVPGVVIGTPEQEGKTEYIYAAAVLLLLFSGLMLLLLGCDVHLFTATPPVIYTCIYLN